MLLQKLREFFMPNNNLENEVEELKKQVWHLSKTFDMSTIEHAISTAVESAITAFSDTLDARFDAIDDRVEDLKRPYVKLSTPISNTSTSGGTTTYNLSDIINAEDYVAGETYALYGMFFIYSTTTKYGYLYSDKCGDSSTNYLLNTTAYSRVASTFFCLPASSTISFNKSSSMNEVSFRIYGYRRIS